MNFPVCSCMPTFSMKCFDISIIGRVKPVSDSSNIWVLSESDSLDSGFFGFFGFFVKSFGSWQWSYLLPSCVSDHFFGLKARYHARNWHKYFLHLDLSTSPLCQAIHVGSWVSPDWRWAVFGFCCYYGYPRTTLLPSYCVRTVESGLLENFSQFFHLLYAS